MVAHSEKMWARRTSSGLLKNTDSKQLQLGFRLMLLGLAGMMILGMGLTRHVWIGEILVPGFSGGEEVLMQRSRPRGFDVRTARKQQLAQGFRDEWQPLTLDLDGQTVMRGSTATPRNQLSRFFGLAHFPGGGLKGAARTEKLARVPSMGGGTQGMRAEDGEKVGAETPAGRERQMKLFEVTGSDNGKTYKMPWWCILVHPEAGGEGKGWEGGASPQGASGPRGVDCRPPSVVNGTASWPAADAADDVGETEAEEIIAGDEPATEGEAPAAAEAPAEEQPVA